uniref:Uncharacterized protein n=1 Tax=Meloidogyne enterolobii TaxID=390850 RepID=A0A6V7X655_MELEN|nr:unnamed protein product [Meloidogyne enterolobii]
MDSPPPYSKVCSNPSGVGKYRQMRLLGLQTSQEDLLVHGHLLQFFHLDWDPIRLKWTVRVVNLVFLPTLLLRLVLSFGCPSCNIYLGKYSRL